MIENILNEANKILIYGKDINSKYLFCNESVAKMSGLDSPHQIVGKTDADLFWRQYAKLYQDYDRHVLQGKIFMNVQVPFTHPKNIAASLLTTETILFDKNGDPKGIAGHCVDITGYTLTKNNGHIDPEKHIFYLGNHFGNDYLTKREFEVFKCLLLGKSVNEIAFDLGRSAKTIQAQIKSIANKLQCSHKSEIVPTAIQFGLTYVLDEINLQEN